MDDRIIISRLAVDCIVGTLPHEREIPQRILVDLEMICDLTRAGATDDLRYAPNYARAAEKTRDFCAARKAQLLETLAEGVARMLLKEFPVEAVTVCVTKPAAIPGAAGTAVEIHRKRT